jgi:hypothetical protein
MIGVSDPYRRSPIATPRSAADRGSATTQFLATATSSALIHAAADRIAAVARASPPLRKTLKTAFFGYRPKGCFLRYKHLAALAAALVLSVASALAVEDAKIRPVADGFVVDLDFEGGDLVVDGLNSVVVGFNAHFGPGEYRGIYEFDLRQLPACDGDLRMTLRLSLVGSAFEGIDPNLTLVAGPGDGALGAADFASGGVVTEFSAFDAAPFNDIDVTRRCGFVRHQLVPPRRPNAYGWVGTFDPGFGDLSGISAWVVPKRTPSQGLSRNLRVFGSNLP